MNMTEPLQEENSRLKNTLDHIGAYIFTKDSEGRYTYANQNVCDLFKCSLEELIGKDDTSFFDLEKSNDLRFNDLIVLNEAKEKE